MGLYIAKKGTEQFYIQPRMVETYANAGYDILKTQEVPVTNIQEEVKMIFEMEEGRNE